MVVEIGDGSEGEGGDGVEVGGPGDGCGFHVFDGDVVGGEEVEFGGQGVDGVAGGDGGDGRAEGGGEFLGVVEGLGAAAVGVEAGEGDAAVVVEGAVDEVDAGDVGVL